MPRALIIDGKSIAHALRQEVAAGVADLQRVRGFAPGLAVVLVGEDPASQVYVRTKARATRDAGMVSVEHKLPADTTEVSLLRLVAGEPGMLAALLKRRTASTTPACAQSQ